jgi:hypothetical protein
MPRNHIRFSELVKTSGSPEIISLWANPRQNRPFMKAVKENRVLTVTQEPTAKKKDFGRIGFHQEKHASYLVFPKPLAKDQNTRVIGIKYDLVRQPPALGSVVSEKRSAAPRKIRSKPVEKSFTLIIRRIAKIETSLSVKARDEGDAKRQALRMVNSEKFDTTKAVYKNEVLSIEER